jgi:hypothetical protein
MNSKFFEYRNFNEDDEGAVCYSIRIFGYCIWAYYYFNRFGWLRLFGYGLKWKDITMYPLLFSERNGHSKAITIKKWKIGYVEYTKI